MPLSLFDAEPYDLIVVGTGFAGTMFLHRWLARAPRSARVLVLERGARVPHAAQLRRGVSDPITRTALDSYVESGPPKEWISTHAYGGGSNCWFACTPRMLPADFQTRSRFGVGADWPVDYDALEAYYCDAEELLQVAGPPNDESPFPRSRPYPNPPHRLNAVDRLFKRHFPEDLFVQPAARPTRPRGARPSCCGNTICTLCPVDAKVSVLNSFDDVYADPRVTLRLESQVLAVDVEGGTRARGVVYRGGGREQRVRGDVVVLAAHAIFNPHLLLRSGLRHPELGRGLGEQVGTEVVLHLDGVDNFGGGTWVVGHWYGLHRDERRRERAAALVELNNAPKLRDERGKWRQISYLRVIFESFREPVNTVRVSAADPDKPEVTYSDVSEHTRRGLAGLQGELERLLAPLPIERMFVRPEPWPSEAHIMGTTVMGRDPGTSVVDADLVHHQVRNLLVLGSSTFPTFAPANPTLTISALALRAADRLLGAPATGAAAA